MQTPVLSNVPGQKKLKEVSDLVALVAAIVREPDKTQQLVNDMLAARGALELENTRAGEILAKTEETLADIERKKAETEENAAFNESRLKKFDKQLDDREKALNALESSLSAKAIDLAGREQALEAGLKTYQQDRDSLDRTIAGHQNRADKAVEAADLEKEAARNAREKYEALYNRVAGALPKIDETV